MGWRLSPSKLGDFRETPRSFYLQHRHDIARPRGIFPSLPGGVDLAMKARFDGYRKAGKMPHELGSLAAEGWSLFADQAALRKMRMWQSAPRWSDGKGNSMIWALDDLLFHDKDNRVMVLDYKTKGSEPKAEDAVRYNGLQMDCYSLFLSECCGFKVAPKAALLFLWPLSTTAGNATVDFASQIIQIGTDPLRARRVFDEAVACLDSDEIPEPSEREAAEWDSWALRYAECVNERAKRKSESAAAVRGVEVA